MSIAATNQTIDVLEARIRRENDERYAFLRMLNATDRALWRLEELNRDGAKLIPGHARTRVRESLSELPASCLEVFRDSDHVQEVLDSVFEVQERLFRWRDPSRDVEAEVEVEVEGPAGPPSPLSLGDQIMAAVTKAGPRGISATALGQYVASGDRPITETLDRLVAAGILRCQLRPAPRGPAARWYFAVGEGSGGE